MGIRDLIENISEPGTLKTLSEKVSQQLGETKSRKNQMAALIEAYKEERLVLVVGAGVSADHGLPNWNTLLQKLLLSTFMDETNQSTEKSQVLAKIFTEFFSPDPLIAARYLKLFYESLGMYNEMPFENAIRAAIYEEIDLNKNSKTLDEIVKLCAAVGKNPNLNAIITYNYDDLIEKYITDLKIDLPFKSIYDIGITSSSKELPIYHVHGFLPKDKNLSKRNKVTLSEDVYHQQYNDIYSWNNMVQINKFRDYKCLMIGLSLTDPNLRRLLDIARIQKGSPSESHFIFRKRYDLSKMEESINQILKQHSDLFDEKVMASLKLDETVKMLANVMEKFEEHDAKSFGVSTIWIKGWDEIPKVLRKVRKMNG